jgi:23S rRNA (cytosine1962-C5)-methyltransferase
LSLVENYPAVRITRKGAGRTASGHPWIFASDVADSGSANPGDAVRVIDPGGQPIGTAHFSSKSQITLRLLSSRFEPVDRAFFLRRLSHALAFRERVVTGSDAYRLVHAEADLLPALIVDRYGEYLVIQTLNQGMDRAKPVILDCLSELLKPKAIVERNDAGVRRREDLPLETRVASGSLDGPFEVSMNSLRLMADLIGGQKTGIYLDQRENYLAAARYAHGRALDCFTSTGGFALHLARVCESITAIDSSEPALRSARANAALNGLESVRFEEGDVFDYLAARDRAHDQYHTVVLDPPAFAKSRSAIESALRGYKEINLRALRLLDTGGILVTCSCSFHVSEADLLQAVASAALDARKILRVLDRQTQSADHPILLTVPETHYLKCLILEVMSG